MEINNFLRRNLFEKHQEIESNKEKTKDEVMNLKIKERYENEKIQRLIQKHPNSIEVEWYLNQFDYKKYFEKYDVKSWGDLERRYNWDLNVGRINGHVSKATLQRICDKQYEFVGQETLYKLILLLYDCFVNEKITPSTKKSRMSFGANKRELIKKRQYSPEELELIEWYKNFDFNNFMVNENINYKEFAKQTEIAPTSVHQIKRKLYTPSYKVLKNLKKYVDSFEEKEKVYENPAQPFESVTVTGNAKVFDIPEDRDIMKLDNEGILRNLLKDRLTEEEKTIVRIFGGKI